jgi:hypothetical protein
MGNTFSTDIYIYKVVHKYACERVAKKDTGPITEIQTVLE